MNCQNIIINMYLNVQCGMLFSSATLRHGRPCVDYIPNSSHDLFILGRNLHLQILSSHWIVRLELKYTNGNWLNKVYRNLQ